MTKILVIEDELFVRENIVDLLEAEEFEVFSTENGILGVLWAQENEPDLVLCDVMMPEMSGHDVLAEMRGLAETSLTPFIFLTAMADKGDIRQGMELGADDYLIKPFTRNELLNAINARILKHATLMKQYHEEHKKAEALEQRIKSLEALQIKEKLSREYQQALLKIDTAFKLIDKMQSGQQRERYIPTIKQACAQEIALLKQVPNLENEICVKNSILAAIFQE